VAYVVPDDLRSDLSPRQEYSRGCEVDTEQASDSELEAAIARFSLRLDEWTGDHFEPLPGAVDPAPEGTTTLTIDGGLTPRLYLPVRVRSLETVETQDYAGVWTEEPTTSYRLTQSISGTAETDVDVRGYDYLTIPFGQLLASGTTTWPYDSQVVRLTGTFGWPVTPGDAKRAVCLMVWNHFTAENPELRWASRYTNPAGLSFERADAGPSGMMEAAGIIKSLTRPRAPLV
jgi:hypothetical protein